MCEIHLIYRYWRFLAIVSVLLLVVCASACGGPAAPAAVPAQAPAPAPAPRAEAPSVGAPQVPRRPGGSPPLDGEARPAPARPDSYSPEEVPGLEAYVEKCERLNRDFAEANIVYSRTEHMERGNSQTIQAAATLRTELPPQEILESKEPVASRVRVSCVIEAELRAAEADFDIQKQGWQAQSLLTSPTARWTWSVTPKRGGENELVLAVRPVIALEDELGNPLPRPRAEASTQAYRIMVDVSVPPDQWLAEVFDRATSLLKSAKGMVVALTGVVVAITALLVAIRWRRAKSSPNTATLD